MDLIVVDKLSELTCKKEKRLSGLGALHINFFIYYTIIASMIINTAFCKFLPNNVFSSFFFSLVSFESLCPLPCSLMSLHLTTVSSTETYPTLPSTLEACPPLLDTLLKFGTTFRSIPYPPHTHTHLFPIHSHASDNIYS